MSTVAGQVSGPGEVGVLGESAQFEGVRGIGHADNHGAVVGINDSQSDNAGPGVYGESANGEGVRGHSKNRNHGGVVGTNSGGADGIYGESSALGGAGVRGTSHSAQSGVVGVNDCPAPGGNGGWFESAEGEGVRGHSKNRNHGGVVGTNSAGGDAGFFEGNVTVTGNLAVQGDIQLAGADYAEDFDTLEPHNAGPGTVMVIDDVGQGIRTSDRDYDRRVAGIVSGAGGVRPAVILDHDSAGDGSRRPLALMGKVYCKVDATATPIAVGDLLTTSSTPGHAMKAVDHTRAFGAVIGKALQPCSGTRSLIQVLVNLQ